MLANDPDDVIFEVDGAGLVVPPSWVAVCDAAVVDLTDELAIIIKSFSPVSLIDPVYTNDDALASVNEPLLAVMKWLYLLLFCMEKITLMQYF